MLSDIRFVRTPNFYAKTATMENLILLMGIAFGYSLSFLVSFPEAVLGMWGYLLAFYSIERWDNPRRRS